MQPGATLATYCKALLALCEAQSAGFDQHAHWIRRALAVLGVLKTRILLRLRQWTVMPAPRTGARDIHLAP